VSYEPPSTSGKPPSWLSPLTAVARIDRSLPLVANVDLLHRSLMLTAMLVPYLACAVPVFLRVHTSNYWRG